METKDIFQKYIKYICSECEKKLNDKDLCEIRQTQDGTARCVNYSRCMTTKCNQCSLENKCFKNTYITAKKGKPIMKGFQN